MANNIGWGQGASNNLIGWGQGAYNNNISWGRAQIENDYHGDTDLVGYNYLLATAFQTRVLNDSGIFESFDCLITSINHI